MSEKKTLSYAQREAISVRIKTDYFTTQEIIEDYFRDKKYVMGETIFTHKNGIEMLKELNILLRYAF